MAGSIARTAAMSDAESSGKLEVGMGEKLLRERMRRKGRAIFCY
jgi:hypothetical protein